MTLRRSFIETESGYVHVRSKGSGDAVLLLHWTPSSSRQYIPVMSRLAELGFAVYAPDHMGYGQSDPRPSPWEIRDYADNITAVMDGLNLKTASVVGGHLSSEIAVELSLKHPSRVSHLILDGSPVWDRAFREDVLATARQPTPDWSEDGSHIAWFWERALWLQRMWDSGFKLDDNGAALLQEAVIDAMTAQQSDDSADALKNYDMETALTQVRVPTLALTAETDPLNNCHSKVLSLVDGAVGHTFSGGHPLHHSEKAADYASVLHRFISGNTGVFDSAT
ncbi:MAG: alpha/beta fold hydrolase [Rhodospirillaceae bacterium]|nr:alpha/beta fold hydrolase [Rhodospirillaceae bacterium]